ncbi:hypothetical protein J2T40_006067 [Pseudomonas citronellolis]|nr:hypothetical protein [Pseudomonas citronellolis]
MAPPVLFVEADLVRDSRNHRRGSRMRSAPAQPHPHHSPVGARLLANEPRSGVCSRASSLLRKDSRKSTLSPALSRKRERGPFGAVRWFSVSRRVRRAYNRSRLYAASRRGVQDSRTYAAPPTPFPCRSAPCARYHGQGPRLQVAVKPGIPLCRSEQARSYEKTRGRTPSPQPSPASGRGGRSERSGSSASAGEFVGRITVRGYTPHLGAGCRTVAPTPPHPRHSHVGARPAREIAGRARSYTGRREARYSSL